MTTTGVTVSPRPNSARTAAVSNPPIWCTASPFAAREQCPGDGRGALVALTAPGRAAIEAAAPGHVAAVRHLVFDPLDRAQAAAFGQAFEAILARLEDRD